MRGMKSRDLTAIVDFIYLGESNVFQDQLDSFLALAEELQLKGLDGSSEEKAPEYPRESFIQMENKADLNQKQNIPERKIPNVKFDYEANTFGGTVMTYQQKLKLNSIVEPDTMAKIESMIEKQAGGYHCNNCGYITKQLSNMREHVEKHIEGVEYPCNLCNRIMRSSASLRDHKRRYCKYQPK